MAASDDAAGAVADVGGAPGSPRITLGTRVLVADGSRSGVVKFSGPVTVRVGHCVRARVHVRVHRGRLRALLQRMDGAASASLHCHHASTGSDSGWFVVRS